MHPIRSTLIAAALLVVAAPAAAQTGGLDLDQFDGRWFEITRSENDVQKDCRRAQIDFNSQGRPNRYSIIVTCTRRADGVVETLRANARVTDPGTNARFRFTLTGLLGVGGLAGQNYRVWDHAPDYSWAIMGLTNKADWWIWHRNQTASDGDRTRLMARARALGFDTSAVVQTGR